MTREEAKEKMYQYLLDDYDLTRSEAKNSFEIKHIDKIYDDFDKQLKEMYIKGSDDCFKALKESGKLIGE